MCAVAYKKLSVGGRVNRMSDKILQLYLIIMAIPLAIMIDDVVKNPEINTVIRFAILLTIVVEWIYSQLGFEDDFEYSSKLTKIKGIVALYSEIGICISAAFAAYQIGSERGFYLCVTGVFLSDLITQIITRPPAGNRMMRRVTRIWIQYDIFEIMAFSAATVLFYLYPTQELGRSILLLCVVVTLAISDFIRNWSFYFAEGTKGSP